MNTLHALLRYLIGRSPMDDETLRSEVRLAVHQNRGQAQRAVSEAFLSARHSNDIAEAAQKAIALIESTREQK